MNSFRISDHCENNVASIDASQCSGDLFQESPQLECNFHSSLTTDIKFSNEKSSETSDELCFTPRRIPRRALSLSHDSSHCYSKKSSDSLRNDSNIDSSKYFHPISPVYKVDESDSSSLCEVNQSSSPKTYLAPRIHHLSKENVAGISFVSESEHSDYSSILDDSLKSDNENLNSKQIFKTPLCSSVKKRTIRQWLNNVSLNCSHKPEENISFNRGEFISPETNFPENPNNTQPTSVNYCIPSSVDRNNASFETDNLKESDTLNVSKTGNLWGSNEIERSNTTEINCPWLFDSFESKKNDSSKQREVCHIHENRKHSNKVCNHTNNNSCQESPNKCIHIRSQYKLSKPFDRSFQEDSDRNISKRGNRSLSFNKNLSNYKSENGDFSSPNDSDSTFNKVCNKSTSKIGDSDDSFAKIRLSRKKKNCLNISSDDSEAKDTANESEDIPHLNNEPYTPRRRLYFRNPLNNSLDDDAKPLTYCKDDSKSLKDNTRFSEKKIDKSTGLLNQIYSEVCNINNTAVCSDISSNVQYDVDHKVKKSESVSLNESCVKDLCLALIQPAEDFNESTGSVSHINSDSFRHDVNNDDDVNKINFSGLSISNTPDNNSSKQNYDIQTNISNKEDELGPNTSFDESQIIEVLDSSNHLSSKFDDSAESIVNTKRKCKKNVLNFSSDDNSFLSEKPNSNIIDVNEIPDNEPTPPKTTKNHTISISPTIKSLVDLTKFDDEYDKYMYRTRSDSSFSENEDIPGISKESSDVISVHTTTSEEEGDEENDPWFDLESYLKKNIPASSKSFETSFVKNREERKARLAKISLPTHSSCPDHTSFLLSLTPEVPDDMCHPEAVKYRGESFSKHKNELVDLLFKLYNKEIFDQKLPPLEIKWSGHLTTTSGITKSSSKITKNGKIRNSSIKLSKTVVNDASKVRDVLLHELCHAANWLIDEQAGGHGPLFKKWVNKIWIKYPEVPKVKTTHQYELKWKYLFKCTFCGYELGKMKLSLNENTCRLCGGLVTVNT